MLTVDQLDPAVRETVNLLARELPRSCIVVAGSAGTGELTTHDGQRVSDLEIGVVGGPLTLVRLRRLRRRIPDAELFWIAPWRWTRGLKRNISAGRPNLMAYDLALHPRLDQRRRSTDPPQWQAGHLGVREAVTLLGNRVGEVLESDTPYHRTKVLVACGDALLIHGAAYAPTYQERAHAFSASTAPDSPFHEAITGAYARKLNGHLTPIDLAELQEAVRSTLVAVVDDESALASPSSLRAVTRRSWQKSAVNTAVGATAEGVGRVLRGRRELGVAGAIRQVARPRQSSEDVIYADLLWHFLQTRKEPIDSDPASQGVLSQWRAFCY